MQQQGLKARGRKRFKCTTNSEHDQPVAANILLCNFTADKSNQKWVCDTSELVTTNGTQILAVTLDLFSNYVAGWATVPVNDRHLTLVALKRAPRPAVPRRGAPVPFRRGRTYANEDYEDVLDKHGMRAA